MWLMTCWFLLVLLHCSVIGNNTVSALFLHTHIRHDVWPRSFTFVGLLVCRLVQLYAASCNIAGADKANHIKMRADAAAAKDQ